MDTMLHDMKIIIISIQSVRRIIFLPLYNSGKNYDYKYKHVSPTKIYVQEFSHYYYSYISSKILYQGSLFYFNQINYVSHFPPDSLKQL